jgi:small redox-active disulfide protein 2
MNIKILGTGCPKCKLLEENARKAAQLAGIDASIDKVTEIEKIMDYGVMMTPALVIDGVVKSVGRVMTVDQIKVELAKNSEGGK